MLRWGQPQELSVRKSRPQRAAGSKFYVERLLPYEMVSVDGAPEDALRHAVLQRIQPSEFRATDHGACWNFGQAFYQDGLRGADLHDFSADRSARGRAGGR